MPRFVPAIMVVASLAAMMAGCASGGGGGRLRTRRRGPARSTARTSAAATPAAAASASASASAAASAAGSAAGSASNLAAWSVVFTSTRLCNDTRSGGVPNIAKHFAGGGSRRSAEPVYRSSNKPSGNRTIARCRTDDKSEHFSRRRRSISIRVFSCGGLHKCGTSVAFFASAVR
jgi:hypothetical protein